MKKLQAQIKKLFLELIDKIFLCQIAVNVCEHSLTVTGYGTVLAGTSMTSDESPGLITTTSDWSEGYIFFIISLCS